MQGTLKHVAVACGERVCPGFQHHGPSDHLLKICSSRRQRQCQFHRRHHLIPVRLLLPDLKFSSCSSRALRAAYPRRAGCTPSSTEAATVIKRAVLQFTFDGLDTLRSRLGFFDKRARRWPAIQRSADRSRGRKKRCPPALASRDRLCRCHQVFCSASTPKTTSSRLRTRARFFGKSLGQRAARPDPMWKGWWCGSRRLRLWNGFQRFL